MKDQRPRKAFFIAGFLLLTAAKWVVAGEPDAFLDQLAKPIPVYQDSVKAKIGGEFRYRFELRDDFNFNDRTNEDDGVNLVRSRAHLDLTAGPYLRGFAEGQDSESFAQSGLNRTTAFINHLDLRQLYMEAKSPWKEIPVTVKTGRQELSYGDQRFVGAFNWSNVGRVFDAVKAVYTPTSWLQVDSWFSQVVKTRRWRADTGAHDDNFYGVYAAVKPIVDHVIDTFFFVRHNKNNELAGELAGQRGQLKEYMLGNRFKGKKSGFDYGIEWAWQFGSRAHNDIGAWAWHNDIGYTFAKIPGSPRISFEYNHASGDDDPADGDFGTFDNLYPTNHPHYGLIDFLSLKNMNDVKLGAEFKPHPKVKFSADYHWLFLDTNRSAWFNAAQSVVRAAKSGASTTLGQELDLLGTVRLTKHLDLVIGYSHFHAGAFAKDTGAHDAANFFYTQFTCQV